LLDRAYAKFSDVCGAVFNPKSKIGNPKWG
jgi:hypothetical protein